MRLSENTSTNETPLQRYEQSKKVGTNTASDDVNELRDEVEKGKKLSDQAQKVYDTIMKSEHFKTLGIEAFQDEITVADVKKIVTSFVKSLETELGKITPKNIDNLSDPIIQNLRERVIEPMAFQKNISLDEAILKAQGFAKLVAEHI